MGGFTGSDPVVNASDLAKLVANGELRYVLSSGKSDTRSSISTWLASNCTVVSDVSSVSVAQPVQPQGPGPNGNGSVLYDCSGGS